MKAIIFTKYGSPDFFELKEVEKPKPKDNEVLIKNFAVSINSWDWEILMGKPFVNRLMVGLFKPTKIKILGCDIAGRVETVGENVKLLKPGDEVFGDLSGSGWGGFAEYVCASENALTLKPSNMTFEQAAAIPQAGLLALQSLRYKGEIRPGDKVLFNGAGGGVGTFGVQIAKSMGAIVTGVDSTNKLDMLSSLGADHVIDYTKKDFIKNGQCYDRIIDVVASQTILDYKGALTPEGTFVMVGGSLNLLKLILLGPLISMTENKKMGILFHRPNQGLDFLKELFEAGKVVPIIDRCYPLNKVSEALRDFGKGEVKGKLVITIDHNEKKGW